MDTDRLHDTPPVQTRGALEDHMDSRTDLPLGFGFSLAMNRFSAMEEGKKQEVVNAARSVQSKEEMERLVEHLAEGE